MSEPMTDEQARKVYALLIDKSWESADDFELWQEAWHTIADAHDILDIGDNGHGRVFRKNDQAKR